MCSSTLLQRGVPQQADRIRSSVDTVCCRTNIEQASTELLFQEQHPISSLALNQQDNTLWCSTLSSEVRQWHMPSHERSGAQWVPPEGPSTSSPRRTQQHGHAFSAATSAVMRSRQLFDAGELLACGNAAFSILHQRALELLSSMR